MATIRSPESVLVIEPAEMWVGVAEAHRKGAGAYIAARFMARCGRWPKFEHYNPKNWRHRGLTLEAPVVVDRDWLRRVAGEARADAKAFAHVRPWLEMLVARMEAEADFSAERMALFLRSA